MKKLLKKPLLPVFLFALLSQCAPEAVRGQSAPTPPPPAGATQAASAASAAPAAGQSDALKEADSLSVQVTKLYQAGKFAEALPLAERALKLREEAVGREHPSVAVALKNLGAVYSATGKTDKARQLYGRALSIYDKNPSAANNANVSNLLDALGFLERFAFNNFSAAAGHYERSLTLKQNALGAEHEEVIKNFYELGELYELLGHEDKAVAMHRRVIAVREKREATHACDLVLALNRFACLSDRLGMKSETLEAERRVEQLHIKEDERRAREAGQPEAVTHSCETSRGDVINGKAISKPQPSYPEAAKRLRITGTVKVFVTVDENGHVIEANPCGPPPLSEAAMRAAYLARFEPTTIDGTRVKVRGLITYTFILR